MPRREDRILKEAAALWRELYGEPLPGGADAASILEIITERLPAKQYDRMNSPYLRPTNISFPKRDS